MKFAISAFVVVCFACILGACSSDESQLAPLAEITGGSSAGGSGTGGKSTGGVSSGGTNTGGKSTAGSGGSGTGGSGSGGSNTGGVSTGGTNTGGVSTGGTNTGGVSTGGTNTGGSPTGGSNTGGSGTGGASACGAHEQAFGSLCVSAMVWHHYETAYVILDAQVDVTEVTVQQYSAWLATSPSTSAQSSNCSANTGFEPCTWGTSHQPVTCVDWCDAKAYCEAVGKRLCKVPTPLGTVESEIACRNGDINSYPYGKVFNANACNGKEAPGNGLVEVASMSGCVTPTGAYDMVGNAGEWVDFCQNGLCRVSGGNFDQPYNVATCTYPHTKFAPQTQDPTVGFRCCAGPAAVLK